MRWRQPITICWQDEWVSMVLWDLDGRVSRVEEIPAGDCNWRNYLKTLDKLAEGISPRRRRILWIIIEECFPWRAASPAESGPSPQPDIPPWMERCWNLLPLECLPERVLSATACLTEAFSDWQPFGNPGTAIYFTLRNQGYLIGDGELAPFIRISRISAAGSDWPKEEWLQQTRMLYRNRNGRDLHRILILNPAGERLRPFKQEGLSLQPVVNLPRWMNTGNGLLKPELCGIHAAALNAKMTPDLAILALQRRKRTQCIDRTFRWGTGVLLGGWVLLLLGACRHYEPQSLMDRRPLKEWRMEGKNWQDKDREWGARMARKNTLETPFRMVGTVARTAPDRIQLKSIRTENGNNGAIIQLDVQGLYTGEDAQPVFRDWMKLIEAGPPVSQVGNLEFEEVENGVAFRLQGLVENNGD